MDEIIFIADPRIIQIPIHDNGEPLIDIKDQMELMYGPSPEIENNTCYTKMRKMVFEKVLKAQANLPQGLRFCLYEAYRSLDLQEYLFNTRYDDVKTKYPTYTHEEIFTETIRLVSPVVNLDGSRNIPPHSTGAAIDIYLIDNAGNYVDMGIHPKDWMQDIDGKLSQTNSSIISNEAKKNRQIMGDVLTDVGFINYPTEFWHWSYGDRYWAYFTGEASAVYGTI